MATKWGIASAGLISHDFAAALSTLPPTEHKIVAVAARDLSRAKDFAKLHNIPQALASYEDLAKNTDVEIVYIGTINTFHFPISKLMLDHGKHVLCEKPLCLNQRDTETLLQLAKEKKLFFMEAVWSRFFPVYDLVRRELSSGSIGEVMQLQANFGVAMDVARITKKELGGGTVLDLGVYVLQLAVMIFGTDAPLSLKAVGHLNAEGVDLNTAIVMTYPGSKTAVLSTSSLATLKNEAIIYGTKGTITINSPFHCPTSAVVGDKLKVEFPIPACDHKFNFVNSSGLSYQATEVRRCLKKGLLESPLLTHEEIRTLSKLEDMIRSQIGFSFPNDP